jgi:formylglycine-generating enzyme required for sulfatase activity/tRNA A-37 threonylcarbamoyl transferase component Bud32
MSQTSEDLLLAYLDRKDRGEALDFEAYCTEHSAHAETLRALFRGWQLARKTAHGGTLAQRIREQFGANADPGIALEGGTPEVVDAQLLEQLKARGPASTRYRLKGEVAHGGMGFILRDWDEDLRRHLAMKVMFEDQAQSPARLSRFLEEAQVTGQLDHPGIVPVHELGIDARGRVFFTMKLVKGKTLAQVFDAVKHGDDGWNVTRALSVVLRVCEAMAFAHEKGVIHRDLKPANVMVGKFGETYVMDWGLARVLGKSESKDIRPRIQDSVSAVRSQRRDAAGATPDSPLLTMDGDQVGTPAYMPPEQAQGDLARIGPHSDVYAVGAILYHLLTGTIPYIDPGTQPTPWAILAQVLHGPPQSIHMRTKDVPVELAAICEKAMARAIDERYASMAELADDLRAYLEHRVVTAYETGAIAEMRKWIQRNRALAAAGGVLLVVLVGATALVANKNREVSARKTEFDQLSGVVRLETALTAEEDLYPAWPDRIPAMEHWLANDAATLLAMRPMIEHTVHEIEARARPRIEADPSSADPTPWIFADDSQRFLHATLTKLAADLDAFEASAKAGVELRLAWARRIGDLTLHHPNARASWDEARAAIAKADGIVASTLYREFPIDLKPQMGLVPIGMNPVTKLWEFYELRSACDVAAGVDPAALEIPTHALDGSIEVGDDTGIVFALIPGGSFLQGAQKDDPKAPNYDAMATVDEPLQRVTLKAHFLARHEMTKGQWSRLSDGDEPSWYRREQTYSADTLPIGWAHPVENVSFDASDHCLGHYGLTLPTEAQWEYAARGATSTPWWTGSEPSSLAGAANVLDQKCETAVPEWGNQDGDFDDGFVAIAPVARFAANPFGLFDVHGNVAEWCLDAYASELTAPRDDDGLRSSSIKNVRYRVLRGGAYNNSASSTRTTRRDKSGPTFGYPFLGVRAARALE